MEQDDKLRFGELRKSGFDGMKARNNYGDIYF